MGELDKKQYGNLGESSRSHEEEADNPNETTENTGSNDQGPVKVYSDPESRSSSSTPMRSRYGRVISKPNYFILLLD